MMMAMISIAPIVYDFSLLFALLVCVGWLVWVISECEGRGTIG